MQKYKKLLAVLICIAIIVTFVPKNPVHADALTAGMLGSIAYSIATAAGINFAFTNGTAAGATSWITSQMEDYANGQGMSVIDFFGTDAVLKGTTALVVGKYTYDKIAGFINNIVSKFGISATQKNIGAVDGEAVVPNVEQKRGSLTYKGWNFEEGGVVVSGYDQQLQVNNVQPKYIITQPNGNITTTYGGSFAETTNMYNDGIYAKITSNRITIYGAYSIDTTSGGRRGLSSQLKYFTVNNLTTIGASLGNDYMQPQPLPQGKQWEGDFAGTPGFAEPPTDLPDFLSRVPAAVADNQLVVTEEITEAGGGDNPPPSPSPSPSPRPDPEPVTDITIAQKIAAILGEIMGLIGLTGDTPLTEEQQQQIADTAQNIEDSVKDVTQNITDTITQQRTETSYDIQEQTQTLTDGQQQIKDAIQDQTQDITDIKDAIEDATQVPTDYEPQKHPLPRGVFPFCIPFDLHDIIVALDAEPVTPEVHIPFRVPTIMGMNFGLDYTFDLDLHDFDGLAQVLRTLEFIAFGVGLLFVTGKVIKW